MLPRWHGVPEARSIDKRGCLHARGCLPAPTLLECAEEQTLSLQGVASSGTVCSPSMEPLTSELLPERPQGGHPA